jgi:hypothetical protein
VKTQNNKKNCKVWAAPFILIQFLIFENCLAQHSMPSMATGHQVVKSAIGNKNNSMSSNQMPMGPSDCSEMEVWDYSMAMCQPLAMSNMPMEMWMIHGNGFLVQTFQEGPRGRNRLASPNMIMADVGRTVLDRQYLNVNLMLTFERWTLPKEGYPEPLQIGERNEDENPYIDGQHPHSSPVMGLTFSDTISLNESKDQLKISFAPRGQTTEGPIAFMHRPTGAVNPDAPLGHHIGQDVSHISSTVFSSSLALGKNRFEASTFNGTEPEPSKVDLPIKTPNSYAGRMIYEFSDRMWAMASAGYVKDPEPQDPTLEKIYRYSASVYSQNDLDSGLMVHNTFVFGLTNYYDELSALKSFLYEFWLHSESPNNFWGRAEYLERTAAELAVPVNSGAFDPRWVTALTAGYTYDLKKFRNSKISSGVSLTKDFLPAEFRTVYGGDPWSSRIFIQVSGMKMGGG